MWNIYSSVIKAYKSLFVRWKFNQMMVNQQTNMFNLLSIKEQQPVGVSACFRRKIFNMG